MRSLASISFLSSRTFRRCRQNASNTPRTITIARPAPTPIPAIAPAERLSDVDCATALREVAELATAVEEEIVLLDMMLKVVVAGVDGVDEEASDEVEAVKAAEGRGDSVDTTCPLPLSTMPLWLAQHAGSVSQQKLPSEHVLTRGRNPVPSSLEWC